MSTGKIDRTDDSVESLGGSGILPQVRKYASGASTAGGGASPTAVTLALDPPPAGIVYFLRDLLVYPWPSPSTIITGTTEAYIGIPGAFNLFDQSQQIPTSGGTWGRGEMPFFADDPGIQVKCVGLPNSQTVVLLGVFEWVFSDQVKDLAVARRRLQGLGAPPVGLEADAHLAVAL